MGQKHNRRRTRSRPRNRNANPSNHRSQAFHSHMSSLSTISETAALADIPPLLPRYGTPLTAIGCQWNAPYLAWMARQAEEDAARDEEDERLMRMFGGEKGDEMSLCGPMLQVVMDLFDGIDYEDP